MHITAIDQPRARFDVLLVRSVSKELVYITMCTLPLNAILTTLSFQYNPGTFKIYPLNYIIIFRVVALVV
jgi:hypothetical protein